MNRILSPRILATAALAAAALGAATAAEARTDLVVSIGIPIGTSWVEPAPAYVQPRPVYVQPAPVFTRAPIFVPPRPLFERPFLGRYDTRFGWERDHDRRRVEWRRHDRQHHGLGDGDHDRDDHGGRRGHGR